MSTKGEIKALKESESICYKWWGLYTAAHSKLQSIISGTWRRISISMPLLGWIRSSIWRPGRRNSIMWTCKNMLITQRTLQNESQDIDTNLHTFKELEIALISKPNILLKMTIKLNIMHRPLHTLLVELDSHIQDGALLLTVNWHRLSCGTQVKFSRSCLCWWHRCAVCTVSMRRKKISVIYNHLFFLILSSQGRRINIRVMIAILNNPMINVDALKYECPTMVISITNFMKF